MSSTTHGGGSGRGNVRPAITLLVSLLFATSVWADNCPQTDARAMAWLDKMSRSNHQVAYHGVVTFQRGEEMQVMQISHSIAGTNSSEQLTRLTGQGAQVVRADHPLECVHPGHKLLRLGHQLRAGNCGIAQNYSFRLADGERIAGRRSIQLNIEPRDMYRYGYVMELDQETGLLLKTVTLDRGSKPLERFQFANLSYGEALDSDADIDVVHKATHPHPEPTLLDSDSHPVSSWSISWLPKGFIDTDSATAESARRTYTDGLAVFSVFLERLNRDIKPGDGVVREGSTTSYTRGLNLAGNPVLVTVIGEVPINTARMVADSVRWAQ